MSLHDIPVKCTRCRHSCMESEWLDKPEGTSGSISMTVKVCPKCGCKSFYDMRPQVAWCWASGLIEIGDAVPPKDSEGGGAIVIAKGPKNSLGSVLGALARNGYQGQLLVPGVPEASTQRAGADALKVWLNWCAKGNGKKYRHGVEFLKRECS